MKKQFLSLSLSLLVVNFASAQSGAGAVNANSQWRINGNSAATSDFIGTTNNQSLLFKTNNILRGTFDTQGKFIWDGGGEVIINPGGLNRPILTNPISVYMLEVGGSGHFDGELNSRQLFVQEYITFMKSLKGPAINVDSIKMDSTRGIYGRTRVFGDVQIKQNLEVQGNAVFRNNLTAEKGVMFDAANGIKFLSAATNQYDSYRLGTATDYIEISSSTLPSGAKIYGVGKPKDPANISPCLPPLTGGFMVNNRLIVNGSYNSLDLYTDGFQASINLGNDLGYMTIPGTTPARKIQIANMCETDVEICKHPNASTFVSTGPNVEIGNPTRNNLVSLNIQPLISQTEAIQVTDSKGNINFKVKPNGYVYAREINVMPTNIVFPDYVFAKDYKLMQLKDVENYINQNSHLPNIPSAKEVEAGGINITELQIKQMEKIEELFLYMIELKKENEVLKKKLSDLESK